MHTRLPQPFPVVRMTLSLLAWVSLSVAVPAQQTAPTQPLPSAQAAPTIIRSAADLPPRNYPLSIAPSEVVRTGEGFQALAEAVRRDDEALLRADIRDNTVRIGLEYNLDDLDFLAGNRVAMQNRLARINALEEKPLRRPQQPSLPPPMPTHGPPRRRTALRFPPLCRRNTPGSSTLCPGTSPGRRSKQARTSLQLQTASITLAGLQGYADPAWQKTHTVDAPTAAGIIYARLPLHRN